MRKKINNLLFAIIICVPMISFICPIDNIIPITNLGILILIYAINIKKIKDIKFNMIAITWMMLFSLIILINIIIFGIRSSVIERIEFFIVFGIVPCLILKMLYIANEGINTEEIIKYIEFIYAIITVFLINVDFWQYSTGRRMSISYYMLPLFVSIIIQIAFYDKKKSIFNRIIKYTIFFIIYYKYINFYLVFVSRGALVAIVVAALICLISVRKNDIKKFIYFSIVVLLTFLCLFFLKNILKYINNLLNSMNIYSRTIERTIELEEEENIGNGRDDVYTNALNGIEENILLGNGIGHFYDLYQTYPHNISIQAWYEGGIVNMLIITIPIIYSIYLMLFCNTINEDNKYFLIFLFCISIVRLTISYEYWKDNYFFMFMYFMAIILTNYKRSEKNGYSNNTNI